MAYISDQLADLKDRLEKVMDASDGLLPALKAALIDAEAEIERLRESVVDAYFEGWSDRDGHEGDTDAVSHSKAWARSVSKDRLKK